MDEDSGPDSAPPQPTPRRKAALILARACFIGAAVVAGYLAWVLLGTGLVTARAQSDLRASFDPTIILPDTEAPTTRLPGSAYAQLIIPKMDLDIIVVEGTDTASLIKGPGHYPGTADPWDDTGRVAIAGHRTTYLAPFWDLDKLASGDQITMITQHGTFDYIVTESKVVAPTATQVADPTEKPTLILTTCNPRFSAAQRLVVFADRVESPSR